MHSINYIVYILISYASGNPLVKYNYIIVDALHD